MHRPDTKEVKSLVKDANGEEKLKRSKDDGELDHRPSKKPRNDRQEQLFNSKKKDGVRKLSLEENIDDTKVSASNGTFSESTSKVKVSKEIYQIVSASQKIVSDSENAIIGQLRAMGLRYYLSVDNPEIIGMNIKNCLVEALKDIGITDWNSLFYAVHPGGPAILDQIEQNLGLGREKLRASRHVLSEYGNMIGAAALFILDEMRKKSIEEGKETTGEGLKWGVLFGFGPGLTVETVVLHSTTIN